MAVLTKKDRPRREAGPEVPELLAGLWRDFDFKPNDRQVAAILHADGPLFLPAGPGSGKTRVLLWRTVNLITAHRVHPEEIFLSTFTEKAALQLRDGLRAYLSAASTVTGQPYDTAKLYVGTVHSLCGRLIRDRRISAHRSRAESPILMDELEQYLFLLQKRNWEAVMQASGFGSPQEVIKVFDKRHRTSRYEAASHLLSFFNRLSEEMIDPAIALRSANGETLRKLLAGYGEYKRLLDGNGGVSRTDLSLLQTVALRRLEGSAKSGHVFRHVIIDEYQDTNAVQERIFFRLASGSKNICVVGDDDQALYRFRGATVENFVEFPERCRQHLDASPRRIVLNTNYRSRKDIVDFYGRFIVSPCCDWSKAGGGAYRLMDKDIVPDREETAIAVVASTPGAPTDVAEEIAHLVKDLVAAKKVEDPNQIAFLFPSLKSKQVERMTKALEALGLKVYAPRAGTFLDIEESRDVFGLLLQVFGNNGHRHEDFGDWMSQAEQRGGYLMSGDPLLLGFVERKRAEVKEVSEDYRVLAQVLESKGWSPDEEYDPDVMPRALASAPGLSDRARRSIGSKVFARFARERVRAGRPFTVRYAVTRATTLDWNVLDFLYQLGGFAHFKKMYDLAESGEDEGPVCNLSLVSQYLARFVDHRRVPISGERLGNGRFRRGEGAYEDDEDPFPRGRVPFITIHQSKGLEFPVVIMANPRKEARPQVNEDLVMPLLTREGEPAGRKADFDVMRMFYVALSRAQNLLVIAHFKGQGQTMHGAFRGLLGPACPRIGGLNTSAVPEPKKGSEELPRSYSYTGDFLLYRKCPRQYLLFRRHGFAPSRSQTMFFGSLVHQTIEDLHQQLIDARGDTP